jgi:alpha-ribazole phosphatase
MEILLIRHGKTAGNVQGRYVGRTDEPLLASSKEELQQSESKKFQPQLIYCSPMLRCQQTAQILFPGQQLCVWEGLEETDFGEFEYKNYEELNGNPAYQAWIDSGGMLAFPGGESGAAFRKRSCEAFSACVRDALEKGAQRIAVVAHGGTIMSVMEAYVKPKADFYSWQVKNGCGYQTKLVENKEENTWYLENLFQV